MTGLSCKLAIPAALAVAVGMTLVSQQACTVLSNDEPTCNECLFQQCTGEWAVCQQNADCMALYTCTINSQPCTDTSPVGAQQLAVLMACDTAAACGACRSYCSATCGSDSGTPNADAGADVAAVADAPVADVAQEAAQADSGDEDAADEDAAAPVDAAVPPPDASPLADATTVDANAADAASAATADVPACVSCVDTTCTAQKAACAQNQPCDEFAQCAAGCSNAACVSTCGTTYPQGTMDEETLATCVLGGCTPQCGN
jgi:hypothetical protein